MTGVYYNENDPFAAAWLRELIKAGHIAAGTVDERSIEDVTPEEVNKYTQCHFFAGIGVWSHALRQAGWPDDRPVWTGSCPCQDFSAAGKGAGFAGERHLWPAFFHLIQHGKERPVPVFGEQVASPDGLAWCEVVQADLERGSGHTLGVVDTCAAGFGAPHIRQRLYWLAYDAEQGRKPWGGVSLSSDGRGAPRLEPRRLRHAGGMGNTSGLGRNQGLPEPARQQGRPDDTVAGGIGIVAHTDGGNARAEGLQRSGQHGQQPQDRGAAAGYSRPGAVNGFWHDPDWLFCRDERWRPVGPGTFPLVNGAPARVGRLRGYGNGLVAQQASGFIEAALDLLDGCA